MRLALPDDLVQSGSQDCVVCMQSIDLDEIAGGGTEVRDTVMLTPCNHVFHRPCLEHWLSVKMDCPICRHPLPVH